MTPLEQLKFSITALPKEKQIALCCGCCEHVLPFFEHLRFSQAPRQLLSAEWKLVFAETVTPDDLDRLEADTKQVIPNLKEEPQLTANIAMMAGISVLETLDALRGDDLAVLRAACSPFEVLQLLQLLVGKPVHPDFELFDIINDPTITPTEIHNEWRVIGAMVQHLSDGNRALTSFRHQQEKRGQELLEIYRGPLMPQDLFE